MDEKNELIDISAGNVSDEHTALTAPTQSGNFISDFRECYKVAGVFCKSSIIPQAYQDKVEDTAIAIDMANRMGVSPLMVMQNLYVVKGKPSWSGQACKSFLQQKYKSVKTIYVGEKDTDERGCYIKATDSDGDVLEGTTVTIAMAKAEGWYSKPDRYGKETSKWQTMPEQMLAYRAASFFARVHCPDVLMGCQVEGEAEDSQPVRRTVSDVL